MAQNFISFKDFPVFLGTQEGQVPETGASFNNLIAANTCEISFASQLEAAKFLGQQPISDDFNVVGAKQTTISLSYIPLVGQYLASGVQEASLLPFSLTGDFESGHCIRLSNLVFKQCYLDSLGVQISPNSPVRLTAQFTSYDSTTTENFAFTGSRDTAGFTTGSLVPVSYSALHSLAVGVSGAVNLPEVETEVTIQTSCARTPIYPIGSTIPSKVILNSVTRQTSVAGENIGDIMNFSGKSAGMSLRFSEFAALTGFGFDPLSDYRFELNISGKMQTQNLSAQPGRTIEGSISVSENIF